MKEPVTDLIQFLEEKNIIQFKEVIVDKIGCERIDDLKEIDEEILKEENILKPLQIKKIMKVISELKGKIKKKKVFFF